MKRITVAIMLILFVLLAASCGNKSDIQSPDNDNAVNIFDLNSITEFLELDKESITILSEKENQLIFTVTSDENSELYVAKFEEIGYSLKNEGASAATISSTYILENGDNTVDLTSISNMELYKEAHANNIEGVEKLTTENLLFGFTSNNIRSQ